MSTGFKSFQYLENGKVEYNMIPTKSVSAAIRPGFYSIVYEGYPINKVVVTEIDSKDTLKKTMHKNDEKLEDLFAKFFTPEVKSTINAMGFNHKMGVFMYGKEGSGKSTIFKNYCGDFISKYGAVVFYVDSIPEHLTQTWEFVQQIRRGQDSPIVVVFEEFERVVETQEGKLKSILDGNLSIDNLIVFATTNYVERIPVALKDRPSRFKYCFAFDGIMGYEGVRHVINNLIGNLFTEEQVSKWAVELKDCTVDSVKQFCLDRVMNIQSEEARPAANKKPLGFGK